MQVKQQRALFLLLLLAVTSQGASADVGADTDANVVSATEPNWNG